MKVKEIAGFWKDTPGKIEYHLIAIGHSDDYDADLAKLGYTDGDILFYEDEEEEALTNTCCGDFIILNPNVDKFYVAFDREYLACYHYNPDAISGCQIVEQLFCARDIENSLALNNNHMIENNCTCFDIYNGHEDYKKIIWEGVCRDYAEAKPLGYYGCDSFLELCQRFVDTWFKNTYGIDTAKDGVKRPLRCKDCGCCIQSTSSDETRPYSCDNWFSEYYTCDLAEDDMACDDFVKEDNWNEFLRKNKLYKDSIIGEAKDFVIEEMNKAKNKGVSHVKISFVKRWFPVADNIKKLFKYEMENLGDNEYQFIWPKEATVTDMWKGDMS